MRRGLPAVVVATSQFVALAKVMMRARRVPETVAVVIDGNPEFLDEAATDLERVWGPPETVREVRMPVCVVAGRAEA